MAEGGIREPLLRLDYTVCDCIVLWKALWHAALTAGAPPVLDPEGGRLLDRDAIEEALKSDRGFSPRHPGAFNQLLARFLSEGDRKSLRIQARDFNAFELVSGVCAGRAELSDLQYLTARELRRRHAIRLTEQTVRMVQFYSDLLQSWDTGREPVQRGLLLLHLRPSKQDDKPVSEWSALSPDAYCDLIAADGLLAPAPVPGAVKLDRSRLSPEALMGRYFGLPTAIRGFDALFSGWGPLLIDAPRVLSPLAEMPLLGPDPIGGRTVLVTGPYGTGKSTLTLEMAVDIARKGGVALIAAMEQSPEECLYALGSLGVHTRSESFDVVKEMREAMPLLAQNYEGRGLVAFLPVRLAPHTPTASAALNEAGGELSSDALGTASSPESARPALGEPVEPERIKLEAFENFLTEVRARLHWLSAYPLRLLIVDPISTVLDEDPALALERRRLLLGLFHEAKQRGINIWITSERNRQARQEASFEENISDIVIDLSIDRENHIGRRGIEIKKSRLQPAAAGRHSLLILPRGGIHIYPSSSYVSRTVAQTEIRPDPAEAHVNVPGIDRLLGPGALLQGDVLALDGPPGSSRTLVGVHFLFGSDAPQPGTTNSLFVSDSDEAKLRSFVALAERSLSRGRQGKKAANFRYYSVLPGSVEPSQILQGISDHLSNAMHQGHPIDRVMVSDLSRWELGMPLVKDEPAFGTALIGLLRRSGVTSVLLADYAAGDQTSILTDLIVNNADCILQFEQLEFRGQIRQFLRATKSREMAHRRDAVELVVDRGEVHVEASGALLRKDANGNVHPVKIRLFLHADSPHHRVFNDHLMGAIQTSLSEVVIEEQWSHYDPDMFRLSPASAVDEVHVLQLDEFQLPGKNDRDVHRRFVPFRLADNLGRTLEGTFIERLADRILTADRKAYIAVPFYQNISLLALHTGRLKALGKTIEQLFDMEDHRAWEWLHAQATAWQKKGDGYIFFSCPLAQPETVETYNCLFFEMLRSFHPIPGGECRLANWFSGPEPKRVARLFRDLCYRSRRHEQRYFEAAEAEPKGRKLRRFNGKSESGRKGPVVWRHWYNTLSQMMWDLPDTERSAIRIKPLFGRITTAGEWYLAVPAYSAAPDVAWQIIQTITAPDRELQRIYSGVGLPTRAAYYSQSSPTIAPSPIAPFFDIDRTTLLDLVDTAFQRSQFDCYPEMSETISAHLQQILDLPQQSEPQLDAQINTIMDQMVESMHYIQDSFSCTACVDDGKTESLLAIDPVTPSQG
jgi:KaiC/GvpD/RAD55 family RecA-like ATPase